MKTPSMNEMVSSIQPQIVINRRNGLPNDFASPEQHMTSPNPWRPWEACMTLNDHWGYHVADDNWKKPVTLVKMLATAANGVGNLLLNIGPRGDGAIPGESVQIIRKVGDWMKHEGGHEALFDTELFTFDYQYKDTGPRGDERNDWDNNCTFTAKGNNLYAIMRYVPGTGFTFAGAQMQVKRITVQGRDLSFTQNEGKVRIELPAELAQAFCPVLKMECDAPPCVYRTGGMRIPKVKHPRYDPCESDIGESA
ncbi:MAG: alpha-L-fucosidase [Lentisphaerae bacterium]|nr:alpha-L-fucosidase [Lentisphaerota bacterium]